MSTTVGWALAALAVGVGWLSYGWPGVALAFTVTVFWLLLQFSRALRVMRQAANVPVGSVPSAVMLQSRLKPGLTMLQVIGMTRSLGHQVQPLPADAQGADEAWRWSDEGGVSVLLCFAQGKLLHWTLHRPGATDDPVGAPQATP